MSDEQDPQPEVDRIVAALDDACKREDWAFVRAVIACADTFRRHLPDGGHVPLFRCGECGGDVFNVPTCRECEEQHLTLALAKAWGR